MVFYVVLVIVLIIAFIILCYIREKAFRGVIMDQRRSKDEVINIMYDRFSSDYNNYKDLPYEELVITSQEGYKLKGYFYDVNEHSDKVVIIHHGYTSNHYVCLQFAEIFFHLGFNALLVDMRSHGESEGKYITYGYKEREDLNLWVDLIRKKVGPNGVIGLHGQSMGGATVLMYAGKYGDKIDFVVADCAYSRGRDIIKYQFKKAKVPFYPVYDFLNIKLKNMCGFDMNKISPIDNIKKSNTPVLFVHGTNDDVVPHNMSEEMFKAKNGKKDRLLLIPGAVHVGAYSKDRKKYGNEIKAFLEEVLNK